MTIIKRFWKCFVVACVVLGVIAFFAYTGSSSERTREFGRKVGCATGWISDNILLSVLIAAIVVAIVYFIEKNLRINKRKKDKNHA